MSLLDFFKKKEEKQTPYSVGGSFGNILVQERLWLDVYYEFYRTNPFVKAAVVELMTSIWKNWYRILDKNEKEVDKTDFNNLLKTQFGNTWSFIKKILRDYYIAANVYVYTVRDKDSDEVVGLQILDPRYMKPITNEFWVVLWYAQHLRTTQFFTVDEIFHLKFDNDLDNESVWMPLMTPLFFDLESDKEARESNLAFFLNNQTPSSLVITERDLWIEQQKSIKDLFMGWQYKGGKNRHRWWIIAGIKEIIKVQDKIDDMQFVNLRKFTLEVVCSVFWVPKAVLNYTDWVNYANWEMQYEKYQDETLVPWEKVLWDFLTQIHNSIFQTEDVVKINTVKDDTSKAIKLFESQLINRDEARELIDYDMLWGDEGSSFMKTTSTKEEGAKEKKE